MFHGSTYSWIPFWPPTASNTGNVVNSLFVAETALAFAILATVIGLISTYLVLYRRGTAFSRADRVKKTWHFEIGWTTATFLLFFVAFAWGASIYIWMYQTPRGDLEVYAVGKQWMWKFQHPGGQREINELHVPVNKDIKLIMTSQDVIHSFFIPAFRVKQDVLPGRYTTLWFRATQTGTYHLFCTQFCGTEHSGMIGQVVVMDQADYENWLSGGTVVGSMAQSGDTLFQQLGCGTCHRFDVQGRGPNLRGVYGNPVQLEDGRTVIADANYIRESILSPAAKVFSGFKPIMPSFQGQVSDEEVNALIAYIKSMSQAPAGAAATPTNNPGQASAQPRD